ncbi:Sec-independent protein translocase subunit TatA [Aurantiacibacter sp. D1-12]|uniref:Sec-independent protein translocase subunit TatA n=1 Tax=Aurantiacibacter sp. D1-12 TaxID=2993658 RepID=UPI00237CCAF4|nr:Sec-independent protein translocase subunit TatA [Aurantiacibacter sp. D1-12]MDE1466997.1 Sec-independent protein translocase subunit TatA [Aurantiacibacter sp. D1-12]
MQPGIWQILIVAIVVLVLFGRGRISEMMGDFGKGISSFKKGMSEESKASSEPSPQIEAPTPTPAPSAEETSDTATSSDKTAG